MSSKGRPERKNIYFTSICSFLTDVSSEMVYPILPLFLSISLGVSASIIGIIEGIAESTAAITKWFSGAISDRFRNRKAPAIFGYSFSALAKIFLIVASSWPGVLLARFLDRLGKGIRTAPRDALISESVDEAERGFAFGFHRAFDTFGAALGVLIAYFLVSSQIDAQIFRKVFMLSLIPALFGVFALFFIIEPRRHHEGKNPEITLSMRNFNKPLKLFLIASFIFSLGNSSNQFLLLRLKNLGAGIKEILLIYFGFNVIYGILSFAAGRLSDVVGRRRVVVPGYLLYALGYFIAARAKSMSGMISAFAIYSIYNAFTQGVERAIIADMSEPHIRGSAMGYHAMLTGIGLLPASWIAGALWDYFGPESAFYFGSIMAFITAVFVWMILFRYEGGERFGTRKTA